MPPLTEKEAREVELPVNPLKRQRELARLVGEYGLMEVGFSAGFPHFRTRAELIRLGRAHDKAKVVVSALTVIEQ